MDISIKIGKHKLSANEDAKYVRISATVYSAEEAAELVNTVVTNANSKFDRRVVFLGDEGYDTDDAS